MNYQEEKKYVGHRDQLMRIKRFRMQEGKAEGVELLDVQNRSGMHFDVNVSRRKYRLRFILRDCFT